MRGLIDWSALSVCSCLFASARLTRFLRHDLQFDYNHSTIDIAKPLAVYETMNHEVDSKRM